MSEVEKDRGNEIAERLVDRNGSVCLEVAVNWIAGLEEKVSGLKSALETQVKEAVAIAKQEQSDRIKALEEELAAEKRGHAQAVSDAHMARSQLIESRGRIKELRWAMVAFVTKGEGVDVEDDGGRYG